MPYALSAAITAQSRDLARALRLCPQGRERSHRTERQWRYRPYQGGEPMAMIDWRQSARGRELVIREHEPLTASPVFFWSDVSRALPHVQETVALLFLALARVLSAEERAVGWLALPEGQTLTPARIDEIFARGFAQNDPAPALCPQRGAILVLAVDFTATTRRLYDVLRAYAAQGNRCLLIDIGGKSDPDSSILARKNWQIHRLDPKAAPRDLLPLLLREIMAASRG